MILTTASTEKGEFVEPWRKESSSAGGGRAAFGGSEKVIE